jgi:membrane associated rhomboid family serine protease
MVCLALFGAVVERSLGAMRFLTLYLAAGVMGALLHVLCDPSSTAPLVGASGAIFGVLAAAGALRPHMLGFTLAFASVEVWHAFTGGSGDISFGCHIGGLVAGAVFAMILRLVDSSTTEGQREPHTE